MTTIIPFAIGAAAIFIFGAGWVFGYKSKKHEKHLMCDSCDHLVQKGGTWKYYCDKRGYFVHGFDIPPEYCKAYKPREETKAALEGESRNGKKHE